MKRFFIGAGLAVIVFGLLFYAFHERPFGRCLFFHRGEGLQRLHLSKTQHDQIIPVIMNLQDKILSLKLKEAKKRIEISELLLQPNPEKASLSQKLDEMLRLKGEEQEEFLETYFSIRGMLNPNQQRDFSRLVVHRLTRHEFRHPASPTP